MNKVSTSVKVEPPSYMENRNGMPNLVGIKVSSYDFGGTEPMIGIRGVTKLHTPRGGIFINQAAFARMCVKVLTQLGYRVIVPETDILHPTTGAE